MRAIFIGILISLQSTLLLAQELTPETYTKADVEARELTLDGMRMQIDLLTQAADEQTRTNAALANQEAVEAVFSGYGTSGSAHSAYGTQHNEAIEAWLASQPQWQSTYQELASEFATLSEQLNSLREGQ